MNDNLVGGADARAASAGPTVGVAVARCDSTAAVGAQAKSTARVAHRRRLLAHTPRRPLAHR